MKKMKRLMALVLSVMVASVLFVVPTMAAKARTISTISIKITGNANAGELVNHEENLKIEVVEAGYEYNFYEMTNTNETWTEKDTPTMKILLSAKDGYRFLAVKSGLVVNVEGATFKKATLTDSRYGCTVTVELPKISDHAGPIASVTAENKVAEWSASAGAASYEVRLVRDGNPLGVVQTVTKCKYDARESMTKAGTYKYEVRAIGKADGTATSWFSAPEFVVSAQDAADQKAKNDAAQTSGTWEKSGKNWKYKLANGKYATSKWVDIEYKTYYFNKNGNMLKGWYQLKVPGYTEKQWVYLDATDGYLWKNATTPDGYYVGLDGVYTPAQEAAQ